MRIAQILVAVGTVVLIVTVGFGAALFVIALFAVLYVLGALALPIVVRATLRLVDKPPVHELTHDDASIPEVVRAQLRSHHDAFLALGFVPRGLIHQQAGASPAMYLALYQHPATTARALSRVIAKPGKRPRVVVSTDLEFDIRYDNQTSAELSNIPGTVPGLDLVPGLVRQMPHVRDVATLSAYFFKLVARYERESGLGAAKRVPLPDGTTLTTAYHEQLSKSYGIQHTAGLLAETRVAGVWRPTWRMSVMIAAGSVSPGAEFFKRRMRVRGEQLQRELDGATPVAPGIGAATGWIMLVAGVALIAAAIVMSPQACSLAALGMAIAWWLAERRERTTGRGSEPGWQPIVLGGAAAMLLLGVPFGLAYTYAPTLVPLTRSNLFGSIAVNLGMFLLPMAMVVGGAALMIEGFRAAAS